MSPIKHYLSRHRTNQTLNNVADMMASPEMVEAMDIAFAELASRVALELQPEAASMLCGAANFVSILKGITLAPEKPRPSNGGRLMREGEKLEIK